MKTRYKITIIVIAIAFNFVLISNSIFFNFFMRFLIQQEEARTNLDKKNLETYLSERINKYQGTVNDYSNWNDTYDFARGINTENYISNNLIPGTFFDIDVNLIVIVDSKDQIIFKQYYDGAKNVLSDLPSDFKDHLENIIACTKTKPASSRILKIGDQYYFIAASQITDSNKTKTTKARMIIGRCIDDAMLNKLKEMVNSKITLSSGETKDKSSFITDSITDSASVVFKPVKSTQQKDSLLLEYAIPNSDFEGSFVVLTQTKTRDLYRNGINQMISFMMIYSMIIVIILLTIFTLLGRFISKPIIQLTDEVKRLDLTKDEIKRLKVTGKDEFSFLRKAINKMLSRIESEHDKVRENEEKLLATLVSVGDGVIAVDRNGIITFINPAAQKLIGWKQEEANGRVFEAVFEIINEHTREKIKSSVTKVFETQKAVELGNDNILVSKDKTERAIEDTAAPIIDRFGKMIGVVLVFRDCSYKKEKRRQIEYLSYHDQLTGLYNRRFFEEELKRLDTARNFPLTVLFADVNGLKIINDAFGHQYGDMLIQMVAEVFKKECRHDDIIARLGGDEFVFLLANVDSLIVIDLVSRMNKKIQEKKIMDISVSVSFGWDTKVDHTQSVWSVLKNAEDIMYQKKIYNNADKRKAVVGSILNALLLKSPREKVHSKRVGMICEELGYAYGLNPEEIRELRMAGELHDIGKIAVDEIVLNKTSELADVEWAQIQRHPETGFRLLGTSNEFYNIAEYVLAHHERWDGKGYPNGLKGEAIPWKARIIAVADAYDAMTGDRPYRKALPKEEALNEIRENAGKQFDPDIAQVFIERVLSGKMDL